MGKGDCWVGAQGRVGGRAVRYAGASLEGQGAWFLLCFQADKPSEKMLRAREGCDYAEDGA